MSQGLTAARSARQQRFGAAEAADHALASEGVLLHVPSARAMLPTQSEAGGCRTCMVLTHALLVSSLLGTFFIRPICKRKRSKLGGGSKVLRPRRQAPVGYRLEHNAVSEHA